MKISNRQYAKLLFQMTEESGDAKLGQVISDFIKLVTKRGDRNRIRDIIRSFDKVYAEAKGASSCKIVSAYKLEDSIVEIVQKMVGKDVTITKEIDPSLIGGMQIQIDDQIIDGSSKKQLQDLTLKLTQ